MERYRTLKCSRYAALLLLIFFLLSMGILWHYHYEKQRIVTARLHEYSTQIAHEYEHVYRNYGRLSRALYDTMINTPDITGLMAIADVGTPEQAAVVRRTLYARLASKYDLLKKERIRQFHFHLPDNRSFLRFHRPEKFGDDLSGVRPTVVYVNREHKFIEGFEEGKIFNGIRFVYPLFDMDRGYVGSVEISFSGMIFVDEMLKHDRRTYLLLSKKVVDDKLFADEKENYIDSPFEHYYYEKAIFEHMGEATGVASHPNVPAAAVAEIDRRIGRGIPFSLYEPEISTIYTVVPLKNPVTHEVVAAMVVGGSAGVLEGDLTHLKTLTIGYIVFMGGLLLVVFREWQLRSEITNSHRRLQTIIDEADNGIALMDIHGNFLEVNPAYSRILGYSREVLLTRNCISLTREEERAMAARLLEQVQHGTNLSKWRKHCIRSDGSEIFLEMSASLLPAEKKIVAVINSLEETKKLEALNRELRQKQEELGQLNETLQQRVDEEVSRNRETEQQMLHQSRLAQMGEMISMIAHQWRQPLSAISATAIDLSMKLMLERYDRELFKMKIANISEFAQHLSKTIDDFRDFYKSNKEKRSIAVTELFTGALNIIGISLQNRGIELETDFASEAELYTYPNELKQVTLNLIKNAEDVLLEKKMPAPCISLRTYEADGEACLEVRDNGGGIPEDVIGRIFEPYFTTKENANGTGLGLYMSKIIVEEHCGGRLRAENVEGGARFTVAIPLPDKE